MKSRRKCVFIITSHYPPNFGGVESHLKAIVESLTQKHNWSVIVSTYQPLASSKKALMVESQPHLKIYRTPWAGFNIVHKLTNYPPLEFIYLFPGLFLSTIYLLIKHRKEIDVIHCQGLVPTAIGALARVFVWKRLISSVHNLYFFPEKGLYPLFSKIIFSSTDKVLAPTDFSADELLKLGVPQKKISRFHYWIDLKHFKSTSRQKLKENLGWSGFNILFVGRLIETKGVKLLLSLARSLNRNIGIKIGGDGSLKQLVINSQMEYKNIDYLGRIEYGDLAKYYGAADLVVMPSLVDEGFGFVVMEAAACGTAVVASNKGGLREAVNAKIGFLVNPTTADFKKKIETLYKNKKKPAREIRLYALKHFSDRNVLEIIKNYEQ